MSSTRQILQVTNFFKPSWESGGLARICVDKTDDVIKKAIELIRNASPEEEGIKARRFVEKYSWENITDEFEGILEEVVRGE